MGKRADIFPSKTRAAIGALLLVVHFSVIAGALLGDWRATFEGLAVPAFPAPFGDFRVVTSAAVSADQGFDPLVANPNDPGKRPLNYPRVWISIGRLFPGDSGVVTAGLLLAGLFSGLTAWLAVTQKSTAAAAGIALLSVSTATWLALERGNTDLLIFGLVAGSLLAPARYRPPLLAAATILKIYPYITTLLNAVRQRTMISLGFVVAASVYLVAIYGDLIQIMKTTEKSGLLSFGIPATSLLFANSAYHTDPWVVYGVFAIGTLAALFLGLKFPLRHKLSAVEEDGVLLAGTLLLFCFVTASNWDYRLIFTLLLVPHFLRPAAGAERAFGWLALGVMLLACNYSLLVGLKDTGILLNAAAKYLLYCILVFSVTRVIVRTDDVQFMIENWRATAKR